MTKLGRSLFSGQVMHRIYRRRVNYKGESYQLVDGSTIWGASLVLPDGREIQLKGGVLRPQGGEYLTELIGRELDAQVQALDLESL